MPHEHYRVCCLLRVASLHHPAHQQLFHVQQAIREGSIMLLQMCRAGKLKEGSKVMQALKGCAGSNPSAWHAQAARHRSNHPCTDGPDPRLRTHAHTCTHMHRMDR